MDPDHRGNWSPATLDSPRPGSIYHATSTMDDLTMALTNYTHASEPPPPLTCCCGRDECEHTKGWQAFKAKLESRLILSAEVGQALLQKYEASVRRTESGRHRRSISQDTEVDVPEDSPNPKDSEIHELEQANAALEKRLSQALLANEVSDSTHKSALRDLEEAQTSVTRLSAYHARTVGLDTRLMVVMREKDDIQQERDSETQRARVAESRISALKERTTKLQIEVHRLQQDLEQRRQHRLELSEEILQDARSRLQTLQEYQLGRDTLAEENEVTKVLESLVADNENLKRDNAELQNLLSDAREDLRALQEEVGEHRAGFSGGSRAATPHLFSPASIKDESVPHSRRRRPASLEPRSRQGLEPLTHIHIHEPLTPEPDRRPLSPPDSLIPPAKLTTFNRHRSRYSSSHASYASLELEVEDNRDEGPASPSPRVGTPHRSLMLLSQSRGVQTDSYPGLLAPSPIPHAFGDYLSGSSPIDGPSEASSVAETNSTHIGILLDRITALLTRLTQADPLTLTNRLKRQHLKGADVGHLSRATVASIVSEASQLRAQFRAILEDDRVPVTCTRKDLRTLFKVFREFFTETGQLRTTLNDIIIDPSIAAKVSEMALDPAKAAEKERQAAKGPSWMAPLTKLFGAPSPSETPPPTREGPSSTLRPPNRGLERQSSRRVPKLGAALAASTTTTVNVEFSGGGGGRATARTASESPSTRSVPSAASSPPPTQVHGSLMNIFAGAPQLADPWVVIPTTSRRGASDGERSAVSGTGTATTGRSGMPNARNTAGMSQNVDAVIDSRGQDDENDVVAPLLQRTLRRRGLSDSSIHSSFMAQSEDDPASPRDTSTFGLWPQRGGMFRSISQTVQQGLSR
ncbi:hypothetical protein FIBSPDRAFT_931580 [Athelia psychrophila]|uniref:Uncharacterized protein n=1 Tax=Athelia psychrophila TaxID=1759441 RepID=A0A166K5L2_9AGAM|nr:hypothetical protein FIBSPDRAFT_931580 [Fibularhizoctonia sp. CBS 109695]